MGEAESHLRERFLCGGSTAGFSSNTPEETDDETASLSVDMPSVATNRGQSTEAELLASAHPCAPSAEALSLELYCGDMSRVPCESDESSSFPWDPAEGPAEDLSGSGCSHPEKPAGSEKGSEQQNPAPGLQERSAACARSDGVSGAAAAAQTSSPGRAAELASSTPSPGKSRSARRVISLRRVLQRTASPLLGHPCPCSCCDNQGLCKRAPVLQQHGQTTPLPELLRFSFRLGDLSVNLLSLVEILPTNLQSVCWFSIRFFPKPAL